jgi:hypothetical protein
MYYLISRICDTNFNRDDQYVNIWTTNVLGVFDKEEDAHQELLTRHLKHGLTLWCHVLKYERFVSHYYVAKVENVTDALEGNYVLFSYNYMLLSGLQKLSMNEENKKLVEQVKVEMGTKS